MTFSEKAERFVLELQRPFSTSSGVQLCHLLCLGFAHRADDNPERRKSRRKSVLPLGWRHVTEVYHFSDSECRILGDALPVGAALDPTGVANKVQH